MHVARTTGASIWQIGESWTYEQLRVVLRTLEDIREASEQERASPPPVPSYPVSRGRITSTRVRGTLAQFVREVGENVG